MIEKSLDQVLSNFFFEFLAGLQTTEFENSTL